MAIKVKVGPEEKVAIVHRRLKGGLGVREAGRTAGVNEAM